MKRVESVSVIGPFFKRVQRYRQHEAESLADGSRHVELVTARVDECNPFERRSGALAIWSRTESTTPHPDLHIF
jgi:hypothetical protein